jgi:glycosyltransferase involved in cell wall biosynthesis
LALITEIIAPYRIPVFNALARHPQINLQVFFLSETDASLRQWQIYKDEIEFSYEVLPSWRRRVGKYNLLLNSKVSAAMRGFSPHTLLCGGYNYIAAWNAALWAEANRVPLLLWCESTARDARNHHRPLEFLKAKFIRKCSRFVVPGQSSAQYLHQFGVRKDVVFTAPNAIDSDFFARAADRCRQRPGLRRELGLPDRYFLFSGRLVTEKGIFDLLTAYAKLDAGLRDKVGLVFAGDGAEKNKLMQFARKVSPGTVLFPGFQHRENLARLYALADALVLPTHSDPWGLVVNEAMACGLPVIASEVAGCVADLVHDGVNGFVIPPRDCDRLALAMTALAKDRKLVEIMGDRSRVMIQAFSPEICAAGMAHAALSVLARAA